MTDDAQNLAVRIHVDLAGAPTRWDGELRQPRRSVALGQDEYVWPPTAEVHRNQTWRCGNALPPRGTTEMHHALGVTVVGDVPHRHPD